MKITTKIRMILAILCVIVSILMVIAGIDSMDDYRSPYKNHYGSDYFDDAYDIALCEVYELRDGFGYILLYGGLIGVFFFTSQAIALATKKENVPTEVIVTNFPTSTTEPKE